MWLQAQVAVIQNIKYYVKLKRELIDVPNATMQLFHEYPRSV